MQQILLLLATTILTNAHKILMGGWGKKIQHFGPQALKILKLYQILCGVRCNLTSSTPLLRGYAVASTDLFTSMVLRWLCVSKQFLK